MAGNERNANWRGEQYEHPFESRVVTKDELDIAHIYLTGPKWEGQLTFSSAFDPEAYVAQLAGIDYSSNKPPQWVSAHLTIEPRLVGDNDTFMDVPPRIHPYHRSPGEVTAMAGLYHAAIQQAANGKQLPVLLTMDTNLAGMAKWMLNTGPTIFGAWDELSHTADQIKTERVPYWDSVAFWQRVEEIRAYHTLAPFCPLRTHINVELKGYKWYKPTPAVTDTSIPPEYLPDSELYSS